MTAASVLAAFAAELALFAAVGYLIYSLDDLAVDLIYLARAGWLRLRGRSGHPLTSAQLEHPLVRPGWLVLFIPAWDESAVIGSMLRATLQRIGHPDFTIMVGYYRNDPATLAAIKEVGDGRIVPVKVNADGPTTKADCLNRLYAALARLEASEGRRAKAIVLHDAEDLVHPLELRLFDRLIGDHGAVQVPVQPIPDPASPWIAGHYGDEFAESHGKELLVRQAVGAAVPLAGVGCAINRMALARMATAHGGKPFDGGSMTEDYEMGLRLGAMGERTLFVRLPEAEGSRAVIASRGQFPTSLDAAVRQKARWLGGIALAGWDRLGWHGGWGERWFRLRDRKGPLAAVLLVAGYLAALLWGQLWLAEQLGAPPAPRPTPTLLGLLQLNLFFLWWRICMRIAFTSEAYGWGEGLASVPRILAANLVTVLAMARAIRLHLSGGPKTWEKTAHTFPTDWHRS